jgi:putative membrane protein
MVRMLASFTLQLLANAVGLFVASLLLGGLSINGLAFVIAVAIFTLTEVIIDPLITKIALTNVPALRGGVALATTFIGLIITTLLTDGIQISGVSTWVLATLIVWLFALIAILVLPLFMFKKVLHKQKNN